MTKAARAAAVVSAYENSASAQLTLDPTPIDPATVAAKVIPAWNFLIAAWDSVENALDAAYRQRTVRLAYEGKALTGRYSEADQDLLRAALIFAGAGLDSTLKRLLTDCLSDMTRRSTAAREQFNSFVRNTLARDLATGDPVLLAQALVSDRPRVVVSRRYLDSLTGGSLQSSDSVRKVAKALGVEDPVFFKRISDKPGRPLNEMFEARNQMIHELDLRDPSKSAVGAAGHRRLARQVEKIRLWATEALSVAQFVVNDVNSRF